MQQICIIWCDLNVEHIVTKVSILCHLVEVIKTTHNDVIGVGGVVTTIGNFLHLHERFGTLEGDFFGWKFIDHYRWAYEHH